MGSFPYLYIVNNSKQLKQRTMSNDLSLYIYLQNQLEETEKVLSVIGNKSGNELTEGDSTEWVTLNFRKKWLVLQIEKLKNGNLY